MLKGREAIEEGESTPAQPTQRQPLVREQTNQRVRKRDAARTVAAAARREGREGFAAARIARQRLYTFGQFPRVAQPEVKPLACHGMQSLRGISQQDRALGRRPRRDAQTERESGSVIDCGEVTDTIAEGTLQTLQECVDRKRTQLSRALGRSGPDQCVPTLARKQRERARRREALERPAMVRR